jgi:RNA polymerase sigma-B factor
MGGHGTVRAPERERLITENMGFVRALARRYADRGEPLDDLVQVGMIGLINAADRFDPSHGSDFRSFAAPTILGEIRRHFRDRAWSVKVPRRIKDDTVTVSSAIDRLSARLGHSPTVAEISEATGLPADRILDALAARTAYAPESLSRSPFQRESEPEGDRDVATEDDGFSQAEDRVVLDDILGVLPARERVILHLRFDQGLLQSQIAERLDISQMHVSRLIARALETLRVEVGGNTARD